MSFMLLKQEILRKIEIVANFTGVQECNCKLSNDRLTPTSKSIHKKRKA